MSGEGWAGKAWPASATPDSVPLVLSAADRDRAILEMVQTGGFADTPALARWAETAEAQPILREFLIARTMPLPGEYFSIDLDACHDEIAAQDALAADIEARFGR
ncbi:MAG: hypothetical protein DI616_18190 [Paracoccus denitrificans]|uniref:Uncharacterized protein n=1 Tax=Paracoccus denitrificans TaxID=266 RepID=A0A533I4A2_PARDE|nr:MAG: hypothetical protein DI616_18190 [Paracoccus denitrificans]